MGAISVIEKTLSKAPNILKKILSATYFLYGGIKRLISVIKSFIQKYLEYHAVSVWSLVYQKRAQVSYNYSFSKALLLILSKLRGKTGCVFYK